MGELSLLPRNQKKWTIRIIEEKPASRIVNEHSKRPRREDSNETRSELSWWKISVDTRDFRPCRSETEMARPTERLPHTLLLFLFVSLSLPILLSLSCVLLLSPLYLPLSPSRSRAGVSHDELSLTIHIRAYPLYQSSSNYSASHVCTSRCAVHEENPYDGGQRKWRNTLPRVQIVRVHVYTCVQTRTRARTYTYVGHVRAAGAFPRRPTFGRRM